MQSTPMRPSARMSTTGRCSATLWPATKTMPASSCGSLPTKRIQLPTRTAQWTIFSLFSRWSGSVTRKNGRSPSSQSRTIIGKTRRCCFRTWSASIVTTAGTFTAVIWKRRNRRLPRSWIIGSRLASRSCSPNMARIQ